MLRRRNLSECTLRDQQNWMMRTERLNRGFKYGYEQPTSYTRMGQEWELYTPETDILELDDRFVLELALPGVVLDDVEIKVEDTYLTVVAKRTPNMFEERATYLRKELPSHFLVREFEFEEEINVEEIEARLERGILFISIPKFEAAIRIPVSAGSIENHIVESTSRVHKGESRKVTVK